MEAAISETVNSAGYSYIGILTRTLKTLIGVAGSVVALGLLGLYTFQSKLVYPAFAGDGHGIVDTPDKYGMGDFDAVDIETADGETLKAYAINNRSSQKTVLILCPNAGNMGHALPIAQLFYFNLNCNVFMYCYRGYGQSTGAPSEQGLKLDADAVIDYIRNDPHLSNTKLLLHGRSLGGAVALYISSKYGDLVKGLMLENTFLSIRKVIPYLFPYLSRVSALCHQIWDSEYLIEHVPANIPVIFLNGDKDEIVPPAHMRQLFKASKSTSKKFYSFPEGHHNDTIVQDDYWRYVAEFVNSIN